MSLAERALRRFDGVINGDKIDWEKYLKPSDAARIVPAEQIAEEGKASLLLGKKARKGLLLPWTKAKQHVLIEPGTVGIWTGWSHHGKTNALKQAMLFAITQSEKPLICSMEEKIIKVWRDMAIMACGTDEPSFRVVDDYIRFVTGKLWLYDQTGRIEPIRLQAVCRYAAKELGVTQVVIDSLMMLKMKRDDYDVQAEFVADLMAIAKETGLTIHLVAHMRKTDGKTGEDKMGGPHDVAGGHELTSMVDYVFNVWRNKKKDPNKPAAIIGVEKQRGDVNWLGTIGLDFHDESRQFTEGRFAQRFWEEA